MANRVLEIFARLRARDDTGPAIRSAERSFTSLGAKIRSIGALPLIGVVAALRTVAAVARRISQSFNWIIEVNQETQSLRASLATVTGSATAAASAFEGLNQFARETPFQVDELARAFVRMKSLGLDPSREALESYGNTASAFSTSLLQFVEAVADATTGEFERLREFGIRARTEGDRIKFIFRGVTTEVGNNAADIEAYLRNIGNVHFGDAMERQMDTLRGAFSNFQGSLQDAARAFGESGFDDSVQDLAEAMTDVLSQSEPFLRFLGAVAAAPIGALAKMADLFASMARAVNYMFGDERMDTLRAVLETQRKLRDSAAEVFAAFPSEHHRRVLHNAQREVDRLEARIAALGPDPRSVPLDPAFQHLQRFDPGARRPSQDAAAPYVSQIDTLRVQREVEAEQRQGFPRTCGDRPSRSKVSLALSWVPPHVRG